MNWLIEKWDWLRRICARDIGHAYLMELWIHGHVAERGMPDELRRATELFYETQRRPDGPIVR